MELWFELAVIVFVIGLNVVVIGASTKNPDGRGPVGSDTGGH